VRFVGVDIDSVRALAYRSVIGSARRAAPDRLGQIEAHYAALCPTAGIAEHTEWYRSQPLLAQNTIWWHEHTGDKIAYWGGIPHTAVGEARQVSFPPAPPTTDRNAGSYLREHFGPSYVSVGLTFHHGTVRPGSKPNTIPAPPPGRTDSLLGRGCPDSYLLDLHVEQGPAKAWLDAPATLRLIGPRYDPRDDANHHMTGGSLADWFDLIVHHREVTPPRPLAQRPP
jgi:erythromycin esterase